MVRVLQVVLVCFALSLPLLGAAANGEPLRLSIPPLMGSLPIAFADAWGTFDDHGVDVELIGLSDNQSRNLALMAGQIDGMVCDVPTAALLAATGTDIVITSTAYRPDQTGSLSLLTQSYFNIDSLATLMARTAVGNNLKSIAITSMSDLEYHLDALLAANGYTANPEKDYSYWYDMLQVSTFLSFGSVYAAVLPEPYVTYISNFPALKEGTFLVRLSDFHGIKLLPTVIVFRRAIVEARRDDVVRFYNGLVDAIDRVNGLERAELIETGINEAISFFFPGASRESVPAGVLDTFVIPTFGHPDPLRPDEYDAVVEWAHNKGYIWRGRLYADVTATGFCQ